MIFSLVGIAALQCRATFEVLSNFHRVFVEGLRRLAIEAAVLAVDVVDVFAFVVLASTTEFLPRFDTLLKLLRHPLHIFLCHE